ncbi:bacillithiol biosynthesis cysteine-adding enzyme BshC [Rhodocytophaga rosea]|uniref:Putative cysteine ligase BshC n=2 Tax=Rhodocytophaga rosea TaxID=2704465 RepID=A0A6C0GX89_9BACT|nr:bacillithiol biosynthesis cysteine-adding enzyme BshC [Rhodocytophaga rosea]
MNVEKIDLSQIRQFSSFFLDYISQKDTLQPFYQHFPELKNFQPQLEQKQFSQAQRKDLHAVLTEQYKPIPSFPQQQIDSLLQENTFTVTTGHQLNIFGGPLYLMYKLVTVINLAEALKKQYPNYHFVPVYWMATEDHDFAEINHFHLFGKKYEWTTQQKGAVGRMNPAEINAILDSLPEKLPLFEKAYLENKTLAEATRSWAHELFGEQGLLCIDADHPLLKSQLKDVIRKDIFESITYTSVSHTSEQLKKSGYETQVNPRQINFFYLDQGVRERIVQANDRYEVLNTPLSFSADELNQLIEEHPERFSPNVLLRPVYQEIILPNLAYIGGPAEVIYWLQLKALFDALGIAFPIVMPRNFALFISKTYQKKLHKLGILPADLFLEENDLKRKLVEGMVEEPVQVQQEQQEIEKAFQSLVEKALLLDKTLEGFIKAEQQKTIKSLENIEKRLKKAEEKNQETSISQLLNVKSKLFPNGGLQERTDNFLNFYLNDPQFITTLLQSFDPLDFRFQILTEDDQS